MDKSAGAFRTIGEVVEELGLPHHILRYWEKCFPQLRPLQRGGNRRYYRPEDIALLRRIDGLLNKQGYTVKGVQRLLSGKEGAEAPIAQPAAMPAAKAPTASLGPAFDQLKMIRDRLARALAEDDVAARV